MSDTVLDFIHLFSDGADEVSFKFTNGLCYWFAHILKERFKPLAEIMYDPIYNHFVTQIGDERYDITGLVTHLYPNVVKWDSYPDALEKERIVRQCILKLDGM